MREKYRQIYFLLDQQGQWLPRLDRIQQIVRHPDFLYQKEKGADIILSMFLKSSYWLDKELFDENYLYKRKKQNLLPIQNIHLKMVDIGVSLLEKGFPLEYNSSEYTLFGLNEMAPYVRRFVAQCHKKYNLSHIPMVHKTRPSVSQDSQRIRN